MRERLEQAAFSFGQPSKQLVNINPQGATIRLIHASRNANYDIPMRQFAAGQAEGFSHNASDQVAIHRGTDEFFCNDHANPRRVIRIWPTRQIEVFAAEGSSKSKNG
jgi:hypothetical protein